MNAQDIAALAQLPDHKRLHAMVKDAVGSDGLHKITAEHTKALDELQRRTGESGSVVALRFWTMWHAERTPSTATDLAIGAAIHEWLREDPTP